MDIAAMSIVLNQGKVAQQASISIMRMAMDSGQSRMNEMLTILQQNTKSMELSVQPHIGQQVDFRG